MAEGDVEKIGDSLFRFMDDTTRIVSTDEDFVNEMRGIHLARLAAEGGGLVYSSILIDPGNALPNADTKARCAVSAGKISFNEKNH